jgi:serine O-acetyltransferase
MSLDDIQQALLNSYAKNGGINHLDGVNLPVEASVNRIAVDCMHLVFPGFFEESPLRNNDAVAAMVSQKLADLDRRLVVEIEKCLSFAGSASAATRARELTTQILSELPKLRDVIQTDVAAAYRGDPAARSIEEIILAYPCVLAVSLQRFAHVMYTLGIPLLPRMITEYGHERTGADIHPGAKIGTHFFIDHATGVVIGETARIGNHVKLYQNVTLGAKSFQLDENGAPVKGVRRHPKLEDNVIIYPGATILGGDTVIGENSIVGSNVWLMQSMPANSIAYYQGDRASVIRPRQTKDSMVEYFGDWVI